MNKNLGFTLIELLIVFTIIGILTSIILPKYYTAYVVRPRIIEGIYGAEPLKAKMYEVTSTSELSILASYWNDQDINNGTTGTSKYVESIIMDSITGVITITYNTTSVGLNPLENQITYSPYINTTSGIKTFKDALANAERGPFDFVCASASTATAEVRGQLGVTTPPANGILSKFVPGECK